MLCRVTGITRRFGVKWALRGVSLDVAEGSLVVIRGSNGSGKSTLLRVIATALRPTHGTGEVGGADFRRDPDGVRRQVGLFAGTPGLYADLTARENLLFAAEMFGLTEREQRVHDALRAVGLARDADARVRTFSSGMQRRAALARVLLQRPRLLLLDEPFNAFDTEGAVLVNALIDDTRARGGAVIAVLHSAARLAARPDTTYVMADGRLHAAEATATAVEEGAESEAAV